MTRRALPEWAPDAPWTLPGGHVIAGAFTPTVDWLEARRALIGASDISTLYGLNSFSDDYKLWLDKTGQTSYDDGGNIAMRRGQIFEGPVLDLWAERVAAFPIVMRRAGLVRSREWEHGGATVDRLSVCSQGRCVVECKTANNLDEWSADEVPVGFQMQGQWQLWATGRDHVHYVVMGPRWRVLDRVSYRDDELIASMLIKAQTWWALHITNEVAPRPSAKSLDTVKRRIDYDPTETFVIADGDAELAELVRSLPILNADKTAAGVQYDEVMAQVLARVGGAREVRWSSGELAFSYKPERTVDGANAAWRKAHPELVDEFSTLEPMLHIDKLVEQHPELISEAGGLRHRRVMRLA